MRFVQTTSSGFNEAFRPLRKTAFFLILAVIGSISLAKTASGSTITKYQIDLLILENLNTQLAESFSLPISLQTSAMGSLLTNSPTSSQQTTKLLPKSQYGLKSEALSIKRSAGFRLLGEYSWTARLSNNKEETFAFPTLTDDERLTQLSGSITIRRSRYLHVSPNLLLTEWTEPKPVYFEQAFATIQPSQLNNVRESDPETNSALDYQPKSPLAFNDSDLATTPLAPGARQTAAAIASDSSNPLSTLGFEPAHYYHLNYSRRLRSNELHYFDHPKIAMLVKITPIEAKTNQ